MHQARTASQSIPATGTRLNPASECAVSYCARRGALRGLPLAFPEATFREPALPRFSALLRGWAEEARQQAGRQSVRAEAAELMDRLFVWAGARGMSGRHLAAETRIPDSSLRALAKGLIPPERWLPVLRSAAQRLGA